MIVNQTAIREVQRNSSQTGVNNKLLPQTNNFGEIFSRIQVSKHAAARISDREIALSGEQMSRVEKGITKAGEKGICDSLVLIDNLALVVNVRSRTIITAMEQGQTKDNIFTNIDGAVIV